MTPFKRGRPERPVEVAPVVVVVFDVLVLVDFVVVVLVDFVVVVVVVVVPPEPPGKH